MLRQFSILLFISFTVLCKIEAGKRTGEQQYSHRSVRATNNLPFWLRETYANGKKIYEDLLVKIKALEEYKKSLEQYAFYNRPRLSGEWGLKQKVKSLLKPAREKKCMNFFQSEAARELDYYGIKFIEELKWCGKRYVSKMGHVRKGALHRKVSNALQRNRERNKRTIFSRATGIISNAKHEEYPWTVYLEFYSTTEISYIDTNDSSSILKTAQFIEKGCCTGTIIHQKFVLTAAHCDDGTSKKGENLMLFSVLDPNVVQKYRDKLNRLSQTDGNIPLNATPCGVKSKLLRINIYYGNVTFNENGVLHTGCHNISLDIENSPNGENMIPFPGYFSNRERLVIDIKSQIRIPDVRYFSLNDIGLIFLGHSQENTFQYIDKSLPVCLPAIDFKDNQNQDYCSCGLEYGEEYHEAGYGAVLKYKHGKMASAIGLTRGKYRLRNRIHLNNGIYMGSQLIGKANWRESAETLTFIKNPLHKCGGSAWDRRGKCVMGSGPGDSGGPWLVPRMINAGNGDSGDDVKEERITQMAVISTGKSTSFNRSIEMATDLLPYTKWIATAMRDMWCRIPSSFRTPKNDDYIKSIPGNVPQKCDSLLNQS